MSGRTLVLAGAILVVLGLFSGLLGGLADVPRLALSAHLTGVTNGMLLIALGAVWQRVALGARLESAATALLIYGTYANWVSIQLAAVWGAGRLLPIANPEPVAADWQEALVSFGLLSLSLAMLAGMTLVIWGMFRAPRA